MSYTSFPFLFQIRKNCIVSFVDNSYFKRAVYSEDKPRPDIVSTYSFSSSSRRRLKRILDLWTYTLEGSSTHFSFVTLTISSSVDYSVNHYLLVKKFLAKICYRYSDCNFVWRCELQKNGNVHYHIIFDCSVDWKLVRRQWNLIQSVYVDSYQAKMKLKYRRGYFFDSSYLDSSGIVVSDELQYKRYCKGAKANWRNPNSSDVVIVTDISTIGSYIGKYIAKFGSDDDNIDFKFISRWWGCSDRLRLLRYASISELSLSSDLLTRLSDSLIREISENGSLRCRVIDRVEDDLLLDLESTNKANNLGLIRSSSVARADLIRRDIETYDRLFTLF